MYTLNQWYFAFLQKFIQKKFQNFKKNLYGPFL